MISSNASSYADGQSTVADRLTAQLQVLPRRERIPDVQLHSGTHGEMVTLPDKLRGGRLHDAS
jgi:hypothetical protein